MKRKINKTKNKFPYRVAVLAFFIGLNIVLGNYFIESNKYNFSGNFVGEINYSLDSQVILGTLNEEREQYDLAPYEYNHDLAAAAEILLDQAEIYDYDLEDENFSPDLNEVLSEVGYTYSHVAHNMLVGPKTEQSVVDSWLSDEQQKSSILNNDFTQIGLASRIVDSKNFGVVGVIVQVMGKPSKKTTSSELGTPPNQVSNSKIVFPNVTQDEVFEALNSYRLTHGIRPLNIDDNLCRFAEKRVGDLVALGSLDNHDGFRRDFEDQENLPDYIKNYSGSKFAENLAHQHCKNMTTGDSFVAQTGTAIIEWCFDSSTKGHREAQLSNDYKNACVRTGDNMYVVIFGD